MNTFPVDLNRDEMRLLALCLDKAQIGGLTSIRVAASAIAKLDAAAAVLDEQAPAQAGVTTTPADPPKPPLRMVPLEAPAEPVENGTPSP